ncbi:hypothetical protein SANTM175S_06148 [Streptomyces antimycoticus]
MPGGRVRPRSGRCPTEGRRWSWGKGATGPVTTVGGAGTAGRRAPRGWRGGWCPARGCRGHSTAAHAAPTSTGTTASSVTVPARGSGRPLPSWRPTAPLPAQSSQEPRSPRRYRKTSSASTPPSAQAAAIETAASSAARAGPSPTAAKPGPGPVLGSARPTATARWTVAASGTRHHSSRPTAPCESAGWPEANPRALSSRKLAPAAATVTSDRRSSTDGRAPRVRRRLSTRPCLPPRRGPSPPGARRAGRRCGRRGWPPPGHESRGRR